MEDVRRARWRALNSHRTTAMQIVDQSGSDSVFANIPLLAEGGGCAVNKEAAEQPFAAQTGAKCERDSAKP